MFFGCFNCEMNMSQILVFIPYTMHTRYVASRKSNWASNQYFVPYKKHIIKSTPISVTDNTEKKWTPCHTIFPQMSIVRRRRHVYAISDLNSPRFPDHTHAHTPQPGTISNNNCFRFGRCKYVVVVYRVLWCVRHELFNTATSQWWCAKLSAVCLSIIVYIYRLNWCFYHVWLEMYIYKIEK